MAVPRYRDVSQPPRRATRVTRNDTLPTLRLRIRIRLTAISHVALSAVHKIDLFNLFRSCESLKSHGKTKNRNFELIELSRIPSHLYFRRSFLFNLQYRIAFLWLSDISKQLPLFLVRSSNICEIRVKDLALLELSRYEVQETVTVFGKYSFAKLSPSDAPIEKSLQLFADSIKKLMSFNLAAFPIGFAGELGNRVRNRRLSHAR